MTGKVKARTDYISWDEYFMEVAKLSSRRSKDPKTQVGACIVNDKNHIVGTGYNNPPGGCDNNAFPWESGSHSDPDTKYPYIVHAEQNALLNCYTMDLEKCRMYVTQIPCHNCAKLIAQSGIRTVYYLSDKVSDKKSSKAARRLFETCGLTVKKLEV